jgi:hypothetical protein
VTTDEKMAVVAMRDEVRVREAAGQILSFLAFVEADAELAGASVDDDDTVCALNVSGGSTRLTVGHLRRLREALR